MQNMLHSQIVSDFAFSQIFPTLLKIHQFSKIESVIRLAVHQQSWHYDSLYDHPQRHHFDSKLIYMLRFCMCLNQKWRNHHVINAKIPFGSTSGFSICNSSDNFFKISTFYFVSIIPLKEVASDLSRQVANKLLSDDPLSDESLIGLESLIESAIYQQKFYAPFSQFAAFP